MLKNDNLKATPVIMLYNKSGVILNQLIFSYNVIIRHTCLFVVSQQANLTSQR